MFQLKWVWQNLRGRRLILIIALFLSALTSAAQIINPKLSQVLVDNVIVGVKSSSGVVVHHIEMLLPLLIAMMAVQLVLSILRYLMVVFLEKSSQYTILHVREKLYDNLQNQDMAFYSRFRTGDLMTRLTGDLDLVRHSIAWISYNIVDSVVLFVVTIVYLFTVNWKLTLILAASTPFIFAVTFIFSKKIRPVFVELREKLSDLNTGAQENIQGNRVVKAFNREEYEIGKFKEKNKNFRDMNIKAAYTWQKFFPVLETLAQSLTVAAILFGGIFIIQGSLTYGQLTIFLTLTWALANPMRMLGMILNDTQRFFASANKIIELFYSKPEIVSPNVPIETGERVRGGIKFDHVSFKYGGETVLDDVSFEIKPGETVGIMGPTGSGKTTIVNLISRFCDVTSGSVLLDGVDVRKYRLGALRKNIGIATQDVFLFSDTADGNIAYTDPELPENEVKEYAKAALAHGFIEKMPQGYDTIIGERGVGLSGGQRQRIALARAMSSRPAVLVLDDTTSAVDMETESAIQENLRKLDFDCTKIIIAQRITSVKDADKIIILDGHKIAEEGTHSELIRRGGYYSMIDILQREGFDSADERSAPYAK